MKRNRHQEEEMEEDPNIQEGEIDDEFDLSDLDDDDQDLEEEEGEGIVD